MDFFSKISNILSHLRDLILYALLNATSLQVEAKILRGPHEDLESYLEAVDQLRSIVRFFSSNKSFQSSIGVLNHANNLLSKAILKLEEEFRQLLTSYRFAFLFIFSFFFLHIYKKICAKIYIFFSGPSLPETLADGLNCRSLIT
ncbi:hypothetical protein CsSME_00040075 [Camellia sinensis var. sinensis]